MFGLEILDVVVGLTFVYLLLALLATAINEYLASLLNKRGNELAKGIARLLDDIDGQDAIDKALIGVRARTGETVGSLTERFYSHPLVRPLATRPGWMSRIVGRGHPRLPSYVPARTFAMAFLDITGYHDPDARAPAETPQSGEIVRVMELLKRESALDVGEHVGELRAHLENAGIDPGVKMQLVAALAGAQTRLQKLHDSVEVWFNNAMDRVSGAYKRYTQGTLLVIGMVLAAALNADTLQMWRDLSGNDELRAAFARQAAVMVPALEAEVDDPAVDGAARYRAVKARLDSLELRLGWTPGQLAHLGIAPGAAGVVIGVAGEVSARRYFWRWMSKVLGLAMTGLAVSLGAPFWFDVLNKVITIRGAGRAPQERPKSPEGMPKRAAEQTVK